MSKVYVVTGASSGIGKAVAHLLTMRGDQVLALSHQELDLSEDGAADKLAKIVKERFGAIDGFVHSAGFASPMPLGLIDENCAKRLYAIHALFPMQFLSWMIKANNHNLGASAVLIGSRSTREADVGNAPYVAAKGAVEAMVKTLAAEAIERGVRVNAVSPRIVDTKMAHNTWMRTMSAKKQAELIAHHGGLLTPQVVAESIIKLLDSNDNGRVTEL